MENRRTEPNQDVIDQRREVIPPMVPPERPARALGVYETAPEGVPPVGPRVRLMWFNKNGHFDKGATIATGGVR
jgi:hypothetical protein